MRALVIGASGGIGAALVLALSARNFDVTSLSRSGDGFDLTDEASIARHIGALKAGFDRVFITTGALELNGAAPEKSLRQLEAAALGAQFANK